MKLTNREIDDILHNMSAKELWEMNAHTEPLELNYSKEEIERAEKIYEIMDLTDLEYTDVECLLYKPHKARLCDIEIYCKYLNINILDFVQKALTCPTPDVIGMSHQYAGQKSIEEMVEV